MLGIRKAFIQTYYSHTDGRAERASQEFMEQASKIYVKKGVKCASVCPDKTQVPLSERGVSRLGTYQFFFQWNSSLGNVPYTAEKESEYYHCFFNGMKVLDK